MHLNRVTVVGLAAIAIVASNIQGRASQHKKMVKMLDELSDELMPLFRAHGRVATNIAKGKYDGKSPIDLKNDLEFEIIAAHEE